MGEIEKEVNAENFKLFHCGEKGINPFCTVGGYVNWYSHYGKEYSGFSQKLKTELPYDPESPLLGIYPEKTKTN